MGVWLVTQTIIGADLLNPPPVRPLDLDDYLWQDRCPIDNSPFYQCQHLPGVTDGHP